RRRRAADRRDVAAEERVSLARDRWIRVFVPAGVAPARRRIQRASRAYGFRRSGTHGPLVSGSRRRRRGRTSASAQTYLSDLQRLHDRSAPGTGVGLLSARRFLQGASRLGTVEIAEGNTVGFGDVMKRVLISAVLLCAQAAGTGIDTTREHDR